MLDINLTLMLFVAVVFLLMLMLLNSWLYRPLIAFMEERDSSIRKDLEEAGATSSDVDKLQAQAEEVISQAKNEASAMRAKAIEESKMVATSKVERKKEELERSYEAFLKELENEEQQLKSGLLSQMPLFKESLKAKFAQI